METQNPNRWFFIFLLANALVALFFDGFWLLGYRVEVFDRLSTAMGYWQFVLWFAGFFLASFLTLRCTIHDRLVMRCGGLALMFSFLLFFMLGLSTTILAPYLDPWY
jgi:hypothetical protein